MEFLKQLRADGFMRDDEVDVAEERFKCLCVIAERVHDVVPAGGVGVACGWGDFRDGSCFEYVGCGEGYSAHVHDVEDAVRAGEVIGGYDDEGDFVDEI